MSWCATCLVLALVKSRVGYLFKDEALFMDKIVPDQCRCKLYMGGHL